MKKKDWGNAVWFLFHTLAEKLKPEFKDELPILVSHIASICSHLPCPDCQQHATATMSKANKTAISETKEALIDFLWKFHNNVNYITKNKFYKKEDLDKYKTANTYAIVNNFITIMTAAANNDKAMLYSFHRKMYMKTFIEYINKNFNKYNS